MLNTYPCNPFPISSEQLHKGDNEDLQAQINAIKDGSVIDSFGDVEAALETKTDTDVIAPEFDAEAGTYEIGDQVMYEGKLYEFTSAHETAGEWDSTEVTEKTVADEIDTVKSGLTNYQTQNDINLEVPDRKNLFDKDNAGNLTGKALNSETGLPYIASGWMTSNFIEIEPSTTYTLTTTSSSSSVAFYDSEQVYISGASSFGTKETPSNAKYLRFDYKTEDAAIMQLELGSTATAYAPYIPSVESRIEAVESLSKRYTLTSSSFNWDSTEKCFIASINFDTTIPDYHNLVGIVVNSTNGMAILGAYYNATAHILRVAGWLPSSGETIDNDYIFICCIFYN